MAKPSKPATAHKAWVLIVCLAAALAWSTAMTPIPDASQHRTVANAPSRNITGGITQPGSTAKIMQRIADKLAASPHNSTGAIRHHAKQIESALSE